jgi:hypothetical protein
VTDVLSKGHTVVTLDVRNALATFIRRFKARLGKTRVRVVDAIVGASKTIVRITGALAVRSLPTSATARLSSLSNRPGRALYRVRGVRESQEGLFRAVIASPVSSGRSYAPVPRGRESRYPGTDEERFRRTEVLLQSPPGTIRGPLR